MARRFVKALAAMLLVSCSLSYGGGIYPARATATAAEPEAAATVDVDAGMVRDSSPEALLDRGIALLQNGKSKEAVSVLDAAVAQWEDKVLELYTIILSCTWYFFFKYQANPLFVCPPTWR